MARVKSQKSEVAQSATQSQLEERQQRVGNPELTRGPADPELVSLKHRQIVEGASNVLFEKGFHGTSIRDIAAACDMSMGQLYHYISSKDDILYLMHRHMQEVWQQHLADARFEEITDPVARLEYGLRISMKFLSEKRDMIQFLYTETKYLDREHLRTVLELDDRNVVGFYRHLLTEIPACAPQGRECDLAANLVAFMGVFLSLRGWNLKLTSAADVDEAVDFLVEFIFRGLGVGRQAGTPRKSGL